MSNSACAMLGHQSRRLTGIADTDAMITIQPTPTEASHMGPNTIDNQLTEITHRTRARVEEPMPDHTDYPPTEESLARVHRSGWSIGEAAFTGIIRPGRLAGGRVQRREEIRVEGATARDAWKAVEAEATCGMLADRSWPTDETG